MASSPAGESGAGSAAPAAGRGRSAFGRLLGYLSLAFKLVLFALVFALAVRNSDPVTLKFFLGRQVETSLALALVVSLCAGALFGVLAMTGYVLGLRREGARARADAAAVRLERDALAGELAALAAAASAVPDAAAAGASTSATDRQVPHGL